MILIGCLSIFSGVVVAALYHHDKSKPVPQCLRKFFRITPLKSFKNSTPRITVTGEENDALATVMETNGHLALKNQNGNIGEVGKNNQVSVMYPDEKAKMVNQEDDSYDVMDYSAEWKQLAGNIDMLLLVVSSVLTVASVTLTIILYVMVHD